MWRGGTGGERARRGRRARGRPRSDVRSPRAELGADGAAPSPETAPGAWCRLRARARGGADPETPILDEAALERPRLLAHLPLHEGPVHAQHRARFELRLQVRLCRGRLGEDEEARGLAVETMDDEG